MICRCFAVPNETKSTRLMLSLDGPIKPERRGLPGAGLADLYPRPCEIVSQPLVVFEQTTELELRH